MKKIVTVQEIEGEGLEALLNERVTLLCARYIYCGDLVGVNDTCILLENAEIVYETGAWSDKKWSMAEKLPKAIYIQRQAIESFGVMK